MKLHDLGYDISRHAAFNEIDKKVWNDFTLSHFNRVITPKHFKFKINRNLGSLKVPFRDAKLDIEFQHELKFVFLNEIKKS